MRRPLLNLLIGMMGLTPAASGSGVIFATGPQSVGGNEINASARFEIDDTNHQILVYLLNLESNPSSVNQLIGSVRFTLTNAGSSPTPSLAAANEGTFDVDSNGSPVLDSKQNLWGVSNAGGTAIALCTVCSGGGNNKELLIGAPGSNGLYQTVNLGNNGRNPFIYAGGTPAGTGVLSTINNSPSWVVSIPTITPTVVISHVIFGFGTGNNYGANFYTMDTQSDTYAPEPGPMVLVVTGLILVAVGRVRRASR